MRTSLVGTLMRLLLVVPAACWLLYAFHHFLGAAFPDYGLLVSMPMDGELHFEQGTLHTAKGGIVVLDFGPWWLASLLASVLVLLVFAWRGCRLERAG